MMGGSYESHFVGTVWVKAEEPEHPICAALRDAAPGGAAVDGVTLRGSSRGDAPEQVAPPGPGSFQVHDEIYTFGEPYSRSRVRVLLSLDLERTVDPGLRPDRDYPVSWIRRHGEGRVFYASLGHAYEAFENQAVLRLYLAGIQFATEDLKCEAEPRGAPEAPKAPEGRTKDGAKAKPREKAKAELDTKTETRTGTETST
jgi:hypothetical protein